jgi:tRNA (guanine-N7-)-methyltransferase
VRQHVNPLSQFFQLPLSLPSKNVLFKKSHYPIHLDIGSAKGEFLIELATKCPDWNFVGLEI